MSAATNEKEVGQESAQETATLDSITSPPSDNPQGSAASPKEALQASSQDASSASLSKENLSPPPAVPEKPKKQGSLLNVPSRTSSQINKDPSSTSPPLTGATVTDDSASVGRGSKRSTLSKKRDASKSSSRHSPREQSSIEVGRENGPASTQVDGAIGTEKKSPSRFLSLFTCCGSHRSSTTMDDDEPSAPAKKTKLHPLRETSLSRREKAKPVDDGRNQDDNETKCTVDETPLSAEEKEGPAVVVPAAGNPGSGEQSQISGGISSRDELPPPNGPMVSPNSGGGIGAAKGQPLPPTPAETQPGFVAPIRTEALQPPLVNVQAPTPTVGQHESGFTPDASSGESKRNSDVDMPDATSVEKGLVEHETTSSPALPKVEAQKTDLPPPPPLEQRQPQVLPTLAPVVDRPSEEKQIWLLPPLQPHLSGRKCLVLDLDETLVHSSFKILNQADFTIPVEIEGQYHNVYVIKRPGVDAFMKRVGELYEVVVFTASVSKYGDPLLDQLDIHHVVHHRLFRESCYNHQGNYVKVGRDLRETIIIDNSPTSYIFHPQHALPISSWFSDAHDNELVDLIPVLEDLAGSQVRDVSLVLDVAL